MQRWVGFRLDIMVGAVLSLAAFAVPFIYDSIPAGLVGVMLAQSMAISGTLQYSIRQVTKCKIICNLSVFSPIADTH